MAATICHRKIRGMTGTTRMIGLPLIDAVEDVFWRPSTVPMRIGDRSAMDQRQAPISTQYRRKGTDPSRPATTSSKTPPQFSMTLTEPTLSSSQVTSTRSRPSDNATAKDWRMMAVA